MKQKNKTKKTKKALHEEKIMKSVAKINEAIKEKKERKTKKKKNEGKENKVVTKKITIVHRNNKETVYRTDEIREGGTPKQDKSYICFTPYKIKKKKGEEKKLIAKKEIVKNIAYIKKVGLKKKK